MSGASAPWQGRTGVTKPAAATADDMAWTPRAVSALDRAALPEDNLAPARGLVIAMLLSVPLWFGIVLVLVR